MPIPQSICVRKGKFSVGHPPSPQDVDGAQPPVDIVSRLKTTVSTNVSGPSDILEFDAMRRGVARRRWRFSPRIPGLSLVKNIILAAYARQWISSRMAQRMIDRTRSWEA